MRRFHFGLALAVGLLTILLPAGVRAQSTQDFFFDSFNADYRLDRAADKTATLDVEETLTAVFPDSDQNHGILRALPLSFEGHTLSLSVDSVTDGQGTVRSYSTYKENGNMILKIGDAERYVHGRQVYVISYHMRNVVLLKADHDEFYWDVNGDQWGQTFDSVSAKIHIPAEIADNLQDRQVCYAGAYGQNSTEPCQISRALVDGSTVVSVSSKAQVSPYRTLTFALAFNDGTFELGPEVAREQLLRKVGIGTTVVLAVIPPFLAAGVMFKRWREFGDDPRGRGVIIAEYEPPKMFNVVNSDFMLNQTLQPKVFSAGLIQLAVSKHLKISEIELKKRLRRDATDYELEIMQGLDGVDEELQAIAKAVFGETTRGAKVKISSVKESVTKREAIYKAMTSLSDKLAKQLWEKGYFVKNPKSIKNAYMLWALAPFSAGLLGLFIGGSTGFYPLVGLGAGLSAAAIVMFVFAFLMPARTEKGVEVHDSLLGLKDYIKMAEADRLKFGQSAEGAEKIADGSFDPNNPQMQVKLFEGLLPFAILFGLEKSWAEQFKDIYNSPPDWYNGNMHAFNTVYLASALTDFSTASAVSFSSPSSSSSGGFSGGFSGGGGGGGGGGGW